jgi:acyl-CoA thioesterase I
MSCNADTRGGDAAPLSRRRWLRAAPALLLAGAGERSGAAETLTVYTFGDSILDCGRYNAHGVHPGALLVRNNDTLFPDFRGRDLSTRRPSRLEHRARDGATMSGVPRQSHAIRPLGDAIALVTIGGNDLLAGLAGDSGSGLKAFEAALDGWLRGLPIRPVLLGNVYDPTFGDDTRNFLRWDVRVARANHRRMNEIIASCAARYGKLADIHAHFLTGNPSWYVNTIEPSLKGASEVRRVFLALMK